MDLGTETDTDIDGLTLSQIEATFKGRGAWKKSLPRILDTLDTLDTLAALGRARFVGETNGSSGAMRIAAGLRFGLAG